MDQQKTWLITGAARGIGLAVAKSTTKAGDRAAILARGESVVEAAHASGSNRMGLRCDAADRESMRKTITLGRYGEPHEVAEVIEWDSRSRDITGAFVPADGGRMSSAGIAG